MTQLVRVADSSAVGEARRVAARLADRSHLDQAARGKLEIIVTELARNAVVHGAGGEILLRNWQADNKHGVDVVALDKGPGIRNVAQSLRDGYSTTGTSGTGLGAVGRLGSAFDIYTVPGRGTAVFAEVSSAHDDPAHPPSDAHSFTLRPGVICVSKPGEPVPGDGWCFLHMENLVTILLVDGLGHGHGAHDAAKEAMSSVARHQSESLERLLHRVHQNLAKTRGAAVALARIDTRTHLLHYAGVGNISAMICTANGTQRLVSHHGTAGHVIPHLREFQYAWPGGATLIMWSDGLATNLDLTAQKGLLAKHPGLISAVLYRDYTRGRDDATALVFRCAEEAA